MTTVDRANERYLGIRTGDLAGRPYAKFWNPTLAPLPEPIVQAVAHGPVAGPLLPSREEIARWLELDEPGLENGYGFAASGELRVALVTELPGVVPAMIDWWFGWHSDEPERYKLWHPRAHVHASWRTQSPPGLVGRERYVGYTSCVDEYIGSELGSYAIRFVPPAELGLDPSRLADSAQATAVCARVGFAELPFDFGYLLHYVTRTETGSRMRSRFWVGGPQAAARRGGPVGALAVSVVRRVMKPQPAQGVGLLVHCSQEMSHLASFLPGLFGELSGC